MSDSPINKYEVKELVAEADTFRLYRCVDKATGEERLLQIAAERKDNGVLEKAAYILGQLKIRSEELEKAYCDVRVDPNSVLNYDLGFPTLVDSFCYEEQEGRRVNILKFECVDTLQRLVPMQNILEKDQMRIDCRTSIWIVGRLLKTLTLAHAMGYQVRRLDVASILLELENHYPILYDWTQAVAHPQALARDVALSDIVAVAKSVIMLLGGDWETGEFYAEDVEGFIPYTEFMIRLARGSHSSAQKAHTDFYKLVDSIWVKGFHPYQLLPFTGRAS